MQGSRGPATSDLKASRGREELGKKSSLLDLIKQKDDFCAQTFHSLWKYFQFPLLGTVQGGGNEEEERCRRVMPLRRTL